MEEHRSRSDPPAYSPISCALHDRLEALATLGQPCRIVYRDADGSSRETVERIVDVFARAGEEFVRTAAGLEIRLDRLQWVAGVEFSSGLS
ncbi:MAG TPA: hypothetical protein VIL18_05170 [Longimicrobiales bacterium]